MKIFNLFKKENESSNNIYAPIKGRCYDISNNMDETFAKKVMGDGFCVEIEDNTICSPVDGELTMLFPTLHAFGLKMNNGDEIMVHIGIDTVDLEGKGFVSLEKQGKQLKHGDPVIKIDNEFVKSQGYNTDVIVIVIGKQNLIKQHLNELVYENTIIISE